jgi:hypothetical protein
LVLGDCRGFEGSEDEGGVMSVAGYLAGGLPEVSLEGAEGRRELGKGIDVRREDGEKMPGGLRRVGGRRERYERVEDYDPVLRGHCRLGG